MLGVRGTKVNKCVQRHSMAQAGDPEKTEAPYSLRRRLLTSKGEDLYLKNYEKYSLDFYKSWENVDEILTKLDRLSTESDNESYINLRESLEKSVKYYEEDYLDFVIFLERQRTENKFSTIRKFENNTSRS